MNDQFDELTKNLARSVTRRGALKKFGLGLASMALGLAEEAHAKQLCGRKCHCGKQYYGCPPNDSVCIACCVNECTF